MTDTQLRRTLSLPSVFLYGLGVTIGAGIYVLIGAAAGRAGTAAPLSFLLAAVVMGFSAASFAEFAGRVPVSAGEAAYVRAGLRSRLLSLGVGLLVILSGCVSSAAIAVGSVGYLQELMAVPSWVLILCVIFLLGAIAAWGIQQSIFFAALFTLIEVGALLAIIYFGLQSKPDLLSEVPLIIPDSADSLAWIGIGQAGLLAFFAFIGFEDIVNLAEEVKDPVRNLPLAIFLTLLVGTLIYFGVTMVAVLSVPPEALATSPAPLSFVFREVTGFSPLAITLIAIVATLNGVIIQMIMASRVLYGLGKQGSLPGLFARVSAVTQTPLIATTTVMVAILVLALLLPLEVLAETTSRIVLVVFSLVNLSLICLKAKKVEAVPNGIVVPLWVPICGFLTCLGLLASDLLT